MVYSTVVLHSSLQTLLNLLFQEINAFDLFITFFSAGFHQLHFYAAAARTTQTRSGAYLPKLLAEGLQILNSVRISIVVTSIHDIFSLIDPSPCIPM